MPVNVIAGDVRDLDPEKLNTTLTSLGVTRIDTAASYGKGESEKIIGRSGLSRAFEVDTKVLWIPPGDGMHTAEAVEKSVSNSLNVLGLEKVNVLYCHGPDYGTPLETQARALDAQYKKGRFNHVRPPASYPQLNPEN